MEIALRPSVRLVVGLSAAAAAVAFVLLAGLTAPAEESTLHVSAKCPGSVGDSPPQQGASGAESPA